MKEILSIKDLAERWGYSVNYIYFLRKMHPEKLPKPFGIGKKYHIEKVIEFEELKKNN